MSTRSCIDVEQVHRRWKHGRPQLRLLLLTIQDNYGRRAEGLSFEHYAFYLPLCRMLREDLVPYDFVASSQKHGRAAMEDGILEAIERTRPDAMLIVPFDGAHTPSLDLFRRMEKLYRHVRRWMWSCDSTWRYETLDKPWAEIMDKVISTSAAAKAWYGRDGIEGKYAKSQWGANAQDFPNRTPFTDRALDVAFVGGVHGGRQPYAAALQRSGLDVWIAGQGQTRGRVCHEDMVAAYNRARIVLNFTSSSQGVVPQIKARIFEAAACGACVVTEHHGELAEYYRADEVIQIPRCGPDELVDYLRTLLRQKEYVADVAWRGHRRTLADHTWEVRFAELFASLGFAER